jgi:hypothetical protein
MSNLIFFPTTEKLVSEVYPYGSKIKTTKTDWLEFSPKKGFRHISQTVDPETGRLNAPKKSRYNEIMLLAKDEKGRVKGWAATLGWDEAWQKFLPDLVENFALFTPEQVTFIYKYFLARIQVQVQSKIVCYGVQPSDILPLLEGAIDLTYKGIESQGTENYFAEINSSLDYAKIAACGVKDFNPFS